MTRHRKSGDDESGTHTEFYDDNGIAHTTPRLLKKVNYAEIENGYDYIEESDTNSGGTAAVGANYSDTGTGRRRGRRPGQRNKRVRDDDDDDDVSFHEEDVDDDDDDDDDVDDGDEYIDPADDRKRIARRRDKNFIVKDDEDGSDGNEDYSIKEEDLDEDEDDGDEDEEDDDGTVRRGRRPKRSAARSTRREQPPRKLRPHRTRSSRVVDDDEDDDDTVGSGRHRSASARTREALTLEDEIRELQEDSPIREKRSLRERTKPVNYTIPPPLSENQIGAMEATSVPGIPPGTLPYQSSVYQSPRGKRGLHSGQSFGPIRRLFPTGGPFGGNDVTAIFGKNVQFYNSNPNALNEQSNKFLDSDSSDDEILPLGMKPKPKDPSKQKKKKKPEIADLDPLGVDMNINFDDVGGLDNYIDQLKEMVALPLLYPELYQNFNITPPRGVLFHGPPGTGKTLMARALAASCSNEKRKITFFMRKGADILSKWVGEAERQLRLLFEEAKKHQPAIIFFDEIDGLAPVRSSKQEQIHASIVSTMLALMDGMDNRGQIIIIGATNRPDAVDPALRRPGRFDREFYFPLPDLKARDKILHIHTKKWNPPISDQFISKLASLTKGYGGADLRALCTEASLISIQRKFPQIYKSEEKLKIDPKSVRVKARDFMLALEKIVPSSARATGSTAQPLPKYVEPLLAQQFINVKDQLNLLLPKQSTKLKSGSSIIQYYLENEDLEDSDDEEGTGFDKHEFLKLIKKSRVCKPKLLITGPPGNGLQYIASATLHFLEDYNIQMLDIPTLVSESSRTMEAALVQTFAEAKKRQPSVICIPNLELWLQACPQSCLITLTTLFRSLQSNENVVLLAIADGLSRAEIEDGPLAMFSFGPNIVNINEPSPHQRFMYFKTVADLIKMKPSQYIESRKRKKPLPKLPVVETSQEIDENGRLLTEEEKLRLELKKFQHQDMKLKNTLKIKLSGLMDLFKNRYKRFRKPPIDDTFLIHLFEPETFAANQGWQPAYVKDGDMILEVATGRKFYNMDLDIIEERLWNGYYSEPKQFLKDIELIYLDATTSADRERVIKASEMFANAQVGIEDISQPEFVAECKATRQRELLRQELFIKEKSERVDKEQQILLQNNPTQTDSIATVELTTASGNQVQSQAQLDAGTLDLGETSQVEPFTTQPVNFGTNDADLAKTDTVQDYSESRLTNAENGFAQTSHNNSHLTVDTEDATNKEQEKQPPSVTEAEVEPEAQSEPEPESEPESELEPEPEFVYDESRALSLISALEKNTQNFTVEKLEEVYASIANVIWNNRLSWDKTDALDQLEGLIKTL